MTIKKAVIFAVCVFLASALLLQVTADAQQQAAREQRLKRAVESFITLWLLEMTKALNLSEEQTAMIYPAVHSTEREKSMLQEEVVKKIAELKVILSQEEPENQVLVSLIRSIKKLRNQVRAKDEELESFIEKNLTVEQRAKYIIFATEFVKGMRDRLNKMRRQQKTLLNKR